ncbi:MAG: AzlC family ABC transporter permease [Azoarcus sp.]|nr:AzlC family ABC transporter permease [Azoarcus sp.]
MPRSLKAAPPIMIGYIALGIPCGILSVKAGMSVLQVVLLSMLLYSGSGQRWPPPTPSALSSGRGSIASTRPWPLLR